MAPSVLSGSRALIAAILLGIVVGSTVAYILLPGGGRSVIEEQERQIALYEETLCQLEGRVAELESEFATFRAMEGEVEGLRAGIKVLQGRLLEAEAGLKGDFHVWWGEYRKLLNVDYSSYLGFLRGAYAMRVDEARSYLLNADLLRRSGFDSLLLGADVVLDPETEEPYTPGQDVFFYVQAFKRAGFRVLLVPDPMHPSLDMGEGFAWESGEEGKYQPSPKLLRKFDGAVLHLAQMSEEYGVYGFLSCVEPFKLSRDIEATSD